MTDKAETDPEAYIRHEESKKTNTLMQFFYISPTKDQGLWKELVI
jgi:hypothetical protein